jgi:hypothetical protein
MQSRAHGNGNKPLLPLLVWRGWTARNSPLPFISHVAFPLSLSPLFFSPPVLLFLSLLPFLLLLFSSSTAPHTQLETHIQKQKKERKNKTKKKKTPHTKQKIEKGNKENRKKTKKRRMKRSQRKKKKL